MKPFTVLSALALVACTSDAATPTPAPAAVTETVMSGEFQLIATGFSQEVVGIARYKYLPEAHLAYIFLPALAGPSDTTEFSAGPLPEFLIPKTIPWQEHALNGYDNGVETVPMSVQVAAGDPNMHFLIHAKLEGWTPDGSKGVGLQVVTVFLD